MLPESKEQQNAPRWYRDLEFVLIVLITVTVLIAGCLRDLRDLLDFTQFMCLVTLWRKKIELKNHCVHIWQPYTDICPNSSSPRCLANNTRVGTQAALGECVPEIAKVLSVSQYLISLDDGITRIKERRTAWLQFHSIQDESRARMLQSYLAKMQIFNLLHHQGISVLRDKRLALAIGIILRGTIEIVIRKCSIFFKLRRE